MEDQKRITADNGVRPPNRLIHEVSPYLLQHARNPVDWYPWGDEAFARAAAEDKPVFLSIGYATCHWCHVMEQESFEDTAVARVMNDLFIAIKVDREERPDIDSLYMTASQLLSGGGGWPLNVILTPDRRPFYAMTYIPREPRFGNPGIIDLLQKIGTMWKAEREKFLSVSRNIAEALGGGPEKGRSPNRGILDAGFEDLRLRYDRVHGGFGAAPKFPLPHNLLFLLRYAALKHDDRAKRMVEQTLAAMASGGIHDQLGSGFHRYSTDARWLVPHFEKMLYDQALLILAFTEAYQATGNPAFGQTARDCLEYVLRDMTSPEGGFYSAQDADTAGEEGGYYLWTKKEIEALLPGDLAAVAIDAWHLTTAGNFIDPVNGERSGKNILHLTKRPGDVPSAGGSVPSEFYARLASARDILLEARGKREQPLTDDKVLADWNGLMIAACARAARVFGEDRYREAAERACTFILTNLRATDGGLLHRYRNGTAGIAGLSADYAFLIFGLTELYLTTFDPAYLSTARDLEQYFHAQFWDPRKGGYFTAPASGTDLISRQKDLYDGAIPSANAVAFTNLLRLTMLSGDISYEKRASDLARLYADHLSQSPAAYTFFLCGLCLVFGPANEVVIAEGAEDKENAEEMAQVLNAHYLPFTVALMKHHDESGRLGSVAPFTRELLPLEGKSTAYVCSRHSCSRPVTSTAELMGQIEKK